MKNQNKYSFDVYKHKKEKILNRLILNFTSRYVNSPKEKLTQDIIELLTSSTLIVHDCFFDYGKFRDKIKLWSRKKFLCPTHDPLVSQNRQRILFSLYRSPVRGVSGMSIDTPRILEISKSELQFQSVRQ